MENTTVGTPTSQVLRNGSTPGSPMSLSGVGTPVSVTANLLPSASTPLSDNMDSEAAGDGEDNNDEYETVELVPISDAHVKHVKKIISLFEIPKKKVIEVSSLGSLLRCLNRNPTEAQVAKLAKAGIEDTSQNASSSTPVVNFESVLRLYRRASLKPCDNYRTLVDAFASFDEHNVGYIPTSQFKQMMIQMGEPTLTDVEMEDLLKDADVDGKIVYHEFVAVMTSNMSLLERDVKKKPTKKKTGAKK